MLMGIFSSHDSSTHVEKTSSLQSVLSSHTSHAMDDSHCDDEGQLGHKCHLGHCAFPVRSVFMGFLSFEENSVFGSYKHTLPSAVIYSFYRPPIS